MSEPAQGSLFGPIEEPHEREVRQRWCHLVRDRLPKAAKERSWSIIADHCFARILLDVTLHRPWRDVVTPPAWRHTPIDQLEQAIVLGEALLDRSEDIDNLNEISLKLRRCRGGSPAVATDQQKLTFDMGET